ncbi:MAG: hypothetical protein ACJA1H_002829 [Glaciecola sp.]|jgi:hypothetical protein
MTINLKRLIVILIIVNFSLVNAQVGIGTTTPAYTFHTINNGNIGATPLGAFENSGIEGLGLSSTNFNTTNGYNAIEGITNYFGTAFIPAGVFGLALNVSVGSFNPIGIRGHSNSWQGAGVYGSRYNGGGADTGWGGQFYDDLGYTGFFGTISDQRTKKDISQINNALTIIDELNPVTYFFDLEKYPTMGLNEEMEYGFIAQEVREILPEITRIKNFNTKASVEFKANQKVENNNESFVAVDYTRIIPILTKGIQEQQAIINTQNSKIQALEAKLLLFEAKLNTLIESQN